MKMKKYLNSKNLTFLSLAAFATIFYAEPVLAGQVQVTQIDRTMCTVVTMLTGTIGKAIAIFAIIFIGVSLFMGKVSWGLAISTAIGIGAIFGAAGIVGTLSGKDSLDCSIAKSCGVATNKDKACYDTSSKTCVACT
jgi:type IV secretory pathway VirB2 component (pilin)